MESSAHTDEPPRKMCVAEFTPIPDEYTTIPLLREVIAQSNAEPNPRKRFAKGIALYGEGIRRALKAKDLDAAGIMAKEAVCEKHLALKAATTIAPLLYAFFQAGKHAEAEELLTRMMDAAPTTAMNSGAGSAAPQQAACDIYDDAVMTVAIRILSAQGAAVDKISALLGRIPKGYLKRRILHESLDVALRRGDVALARAVFYTAVEGKVDLWDADYEKLLKTLANADAKADADASPWPAEGWTSGRVALREVLTHMEQSTPVVGRSVGEAMAALASRHQYKCVDVATGACGGCGRCLRGFTLSEEAFAGLATDILEKLVAPALARRSHYEGEGGVLAEEEVAERRRIFDEFCARVASDTFDAVVDGANVGYYGVSNWYPAAKKDLLVRGGRAPESVTHAEMSEMPLPIDVCPNFEQIAHIVAKTRAAGYTPRIILHHRHLAASPRLYGRNAELLAAWREEGIVIESPYFLNDDYCWLYACIAKRRCVIVSNDLMRDHHFLMLSQQSFVRWRQRNRITFRAGYCGSSTSGTICVPVAHSTWVQRAAPVTSAEVASVKDDEAEEVWHIPLGDAATLDQATNKRKPSDALGKDGDDECADWLCLTL